MGWAILPTPNQNRGGSTYPNQNRVKKPKNQNFEKSKYLLETSFYTCTKNQNHIIYSSWDAKWDRQNFCHFGPFLSFYHHTHPLPSHLMPNDPEYQNFEKKMKKMLGDIILLYIHVYHKLWSYDIVPEI